MSILAKIQPKPRFWLKAFLLLLPFLSVVAVYFVFDPFMVLHRYKRFDNTHVMLGEAYVGWQNYMANRDSIPFNSFIMGNSCTMAFRSDEWEKHLDHSDRAVRFFDTGESLGGVCQKLQVLDSAGAPIKHVLVVANKTMLKDIFPMQENGHLFAPEAAKVSPLEFQLSFLQKFLDPNIAIPYLGYLASGKYSSYMKGVISPDAPIREPYTNNFINPHEKEIQRLGERYWQRYKTEFTPRREAGKEEERTVYCEQLKLLRKIRAVCDKHGADLKFIIGPEYNQKRTNHEDIALLKAILGASSVWDFTGINPYTSDIRNYYDRGHFRPEVGKQLLEFIYQKKNS
ncbi:hypothetical protein [uncultured Acetobacteroides sp.]|uniref:hypothetical protein n=1 Tax=uncultured Acetobacteroides sp. TaxID=1760811 RepID=UPI0029F5CC84|nr:hypothetical protein [uncultured Acetobacteroides sp.]